MRAFEAFTYATVISDLLDAGFDYALVAELAQYQDTRGHAAWLGVGTTIALLLELVVKTMLRRMKDKHTAEGTNKSSSEGDEDRGLDMNTEEGRNLYYIFSAAVALAIFFLEDATTVFVWWQTGTYDSKSGIAQANLITTVVSAIGAVVALAYGMIRSMGLDYNMCSCKEGMQEWDGPWRGCTTWCGTWIITSIPIMIFLAPILFWAVFALTTIQGGEWYDCIGSCAATANATANATTATFAGPDALDLGGSGSFFGSDGSGGSDAGWEVNAHLNRAVYAVYIFGGIVAVVGGGYATSAAVGDVIDIDACNERCGW